VPADSGAQGSPSQSDNTVPLASQSPRQHSGGNEKLPSDVSSQLQSFAERMAAMESRVPALLSAKPVTDASDIPGASNRTSGTTEGAVVDSGAPSSSAAPVSVSLGADAAGQVADHDQQLASLTRQLETMNAKLGQLMDQVGRDAAIQHRNDKAQTTTEPDAAGAATLEGQAPNAYDADAIPALLGRVFDLETDLQDVLQRYQDDRAGLESRLNDVLNQLSQKADKGELDQLACGLVLGSATAPGSAPGQATDPGSGKGKAHALQVVQSLLDDKASKVCFSQFIVAQSEIDGSLHVARSHACAITTDCRLRLMHCGMI
jgi:uncharacterized phage infection (PIP) family protein YhgE